MLQCYNKDIIELTASIAESPTMATPELIANIRAGNVHTLIPPYVYTNNIKPIYEKEPTNISVEFDPKKHLSFDAIKAASVKRFTMEELGLTCPDQISEIAGSAPFDLFTEEAVQIMRAEILREEVFDKWARLQYDSTSGIDGNIRGYARTTSPFTYAAWTHPDTVAAVSAMAGVELEVVMDYEIGSINLSLKPDNDAVTKEIHEKRKKAMDSEYERDIPAIVGWHNDSYPFVCVLMLSDTSDMVGGETLVSTGSGKIVPIEGPSRGKACVLQGRKVLHLAPIPLGFSERITSVTSYRAKGTKKFDDTGLKTVKPEVNFGTVFNEFYPEWIKYRVDRIMAKCETLQKQSLNDRKAGLTFKKEEAIEELKSLEEYIKKSWTEMSVSDEEFIKHQEKLKKVARARDAATN